MMIYTKDEDLEPSTLYMRKIVNELALIYFDSFKDLKRIYKVTKACIAVSLAFIEFKVVKECIM